MTITYGRVPLDQLRESPFNERKTFVQVSLDSLATNIKSVGILQALLVRPQWKNLLRVDIDPPDWYEVVCGHRRLRAAKLAKLSDAPCVVRKMTNAEASAAQVSENHQREGVHALEEAEALQAMRDNGKTIADLVTETGMSESYVYGRLKLLNLAPAVREAFAKGEIVGEIALLFARQELTLQYKAMTKLQSSQFYRARNGYADGGKDGYRAVKEFLNEYFMLDLKEALWKLDDAELMPTAGACTACPKRSGCTPQLFDDVIFIAGDGKGRVKRASSDDDYERELRINGPNVCTDPDCFEAKKKAHLKRAQTALEAKGDVVIAGGRARQIVSAEGKIKGGYVPLADVKDLLKKAGAKADGIATPVVQDPRGGKTHKVVKIEDLKAAGVKVPAPKANSGGYDYHAEQAKRQAESKKRDELWSSEHAFRVALFGHVRSAAAAVPRSTFDLQMLATILWRTLSYDDAGREIAKQWGEKTTAAIGKRIGSMTPDEATRLMLDVAIVGNIYGHSYLVEKPPENLLSAAKHYGIDVAAVRAELAPKASADAPAARAAAKGATGKAGKAKAKKKPAAAVAAEKGKEGAGSAGGITPQSAWPFPMRSGIQAVAGDEKTLQAAGS